MVYVIALQKQPPLRTNGVVGREAILFEDGVVRLVGLGGSGGMGKWGGMSFLVSTGSKRGVL